MAEAELRQEPDWDKFAWALLRYVKLKREQAEAKSRPAKSERGK
jgi:hypothetical protein